MSAPQCRAVDRDGQRCVLVDGHDSAHSAGNAVEFLNRRCDLLQYRIERVRDICAHANEDWRDDEGLSITPAMIIAELEEAPF